MYWLISSVGSKTYTYQGNKLTQFTNGSSIYNYTYNHLGLRVTKPNVQFIYDGDKLITEVGPYYKLDFLYDENNQLYGFVKDNTAKYFYIRDVLGNILGIINSLGVVVAKYSYTAYGTPTITLDTDSIGSLNPFRFKGYYYDTESQMYYCNARYYVPAWGRWLTPDSADYLQYDSITGFNTFAYCNGNPVMYADPSGHIAISLILIAAAFIVGIGGGALGGAINGVEEKKSGWDMAQSILAGIAVGLAVAGAAVLLTGVGLSLGLGTTAMVGGLATKSIFAIGALAINASAFIIAPIAQISVPSIDYESPTSPQISGPRGTSPYHN